MGIQVMPEFDWVANSSKHMESNLDLEFVENYFHNYGGSPPNKYNTKPSFPLTSDEIIERGGRSSCHDPKRHVELLRLLEHGLPRAPYHKSPKRIVIVGAGLTGLTAGMLLKDAGYNVTILEASSSAGGRIQTYRNVGEGWHAELGAMRIPNHHYFTQFLIRQFRLKIIPFINRNNNTKSFIKGRVYHNMFTRPLTKHDNVAKNEIGRRPIDLLDESFEKPIKLLKSGNLKKFLQLYDQYSFKSYFKQVMKYSDGLIDLFSVLLISEGVLDFGIVEVMIHECIMSGDTKFETVVDGMDGIIDGFLPRLQDIIHYNAKVYKIKTHKKKVQVEFNCQGIQCGEYSDSGPIIEADAVILTPPTPVINQIQFQPELSYKKKFALQTARNSPSTKVLLVFTEAFWEKSGIFGGSSMTDYYSGTMYYPSYTFTSGIGTLLASYSWGFDSNRIAGETDNDIFQHCLECVARVHNRTIEDIKRMFLHGIVKRWGSDPNIMSGFPYLGYNQFLDVYPLLRKPEGPIKFGGDITELNHGWIDASVKSGVRTAIESIFDH